MRRETCLTSLGLASPLTSHVSRLTPCLTNSPTISSPRCFWYNVLHGQRVYRLFVGGEVACREEGRHLRHGRHDHRLDRHLADACERRELSSEGALVGVQAAQAAGMQVAVVYDRYSDRDRDEIERLADVLLYRQG